MKYINGIFKISIALLLLLVFIGSVCAADDNGTVLSEYDDAEDFELDEDFDDDLDEDEDPDDDWEDDDNPDDDEDDDLDDDDSYDDFDDDEDDIEDDYQYTDFDFLKTKITYYLDRYGNCSDHNWTESDEFLNEYQIYLANPENYTLNESAEGYQTYLKIFDSVTSTFGDYNLTENETHYLKFMVIFFLNHYGNVSANYTWNDSDNFENFTIPFVFLCKSMDGIVLGSASDYDYGNSYLKSYAPFNALITNSTDVNQTSTENQTSFEVPDSVDFNIFLLALVILLVILIIL